MCGSGTLKAAGDAHIHLQIAALARNDTIVGSRAWPQLKSHALTALAETFGIIYDAHNALEDAETCGKLAQMAAEKYNSASLAELFAAAGTGMRRL